jgi:hypothetical protein
MSFKKRYLEEGNAFWRFALPVGGLVGGAYLGHHLADEFGQGVKEGLHSQVGANAAKNELENIITQDKHPVGNTSDEIKKFFKFEGSVKDIGKAYGTDQVKDIPFQERLVSKVNEDKLNHILDKYKNYGLAGGAAAGGLLGLGARPDKKDYR